MSNSITWISINEWYMNIDEVIIKKLINDYGYYITVISNNNNIDFFYKKKSIHCINLGDKKIKIKNTLEHFIKKYGFEKPEITLWQREITIMGIKLDYLEKSSLEYFTFFEDYFLNTNSENLFHNGDRYFHLIAEKVARYYNKKIIYHNSIGILGWDKIIFTNSWEYDDFGNKNFLNDDISTKDVEEISNFIQDKINKKPIIGGKRDFYAWFYFKKFIFYLINYINIGKYRQDYSFPFAFIKDKLSVYKNIYINKVEYDSIDKVDSKTLFFPMHVPDDAQTTTRAYKFANHYETVEKLLSILHTGYKLAIKEHPHGIGMINMKFFEKIRKKNPNLIILAPKENAYEILNKSLRLITINSDVGYESILLGKKPITLWSSFYSGYGYDDFLDLEKANSLDIFLQKNFNIELEQRIKFIYSLKKVNMEGSFFKNSQLEFNLDEKTINLLSLHINNYILGN